MLRRFFVFFMAAFFFASSAAAADEPVPSFKYRTLEGRWGVGFIGAIAVPEAAEEDERSGYFGGTLSYGIMDPLVIQIDAGYVTFDHSAFETYYGELETIPLIFSLQWRAFKINAIRTSFYGSLGLGVILSDFNASGAIPRDRIQVQESSFAYRVGGGADVFVTDNVAANFEASYTTSDENLVLSDLNFRRNENLDTDFWLFGGGLKVYFD